MLMTRPNPWLLGGWIAASSFAALCGGCGGDASGRLPIAGDVMLEGAPLDRGTIEFHPLAAEGNLTGGPITDGKFAIPTEQGALPGEFEVRIFAASAEEVAEAAPAEAPGPEAGRAVAAERIPSRYNVESELRTTITAENSETQRFELEL